MRLLTLRRIDRGAECDTYRLILPDGRRIATLIMLASGEACSIIPSLSHTVSVGERNDEPVLRITLSNTPTTLRDTRAETPRIPLHSMRLSSR